MAEYIEREALAADLRGSYEELRNIYNDLRFDEERRICSAELNSFMECIIRVKNAPAADVVEVRHGEWKWGYQNGQYGIWCTNCGAGWVDSENAEWIAHEHDYCPKCGAKMDGKGEGE